MHSTSSPLCEFPSLMSQICLCIQMDLFKLHRKKSRKNVNWNQKWAKKQLNILRNVMWLYSCGPPKVPTYRTREGKKMSEQSTMGRGFYTAYSRKRSIDGHGRAAGPNPRQINNSSRTIYLAKKIAQHTKNSRNSLFFSWKPKLYFFGLVCWCLSVRFLCFCCVCWWKFRRMNECSGGEKEAQTVKYAKRIK